MDEKLAHTIVILIKLGYDRKKIKYFINTLDDSKYINASVEKIVQDFIDSIDQGDND